MKPEQKAWELINKYLKIQVEYSYVVESGEGIGEDVYDSKTLSLHEAKECALVAVDEILREVPTEILDTYKGETNFISNDRFEFWQQVKEEIEKH